jgi:hypothetical protein
MKGREKGRGRRGKGGGEGRISDENLQKVSQNIDNTIKNIDNTVKIP